MHLRDFRAQNLSTQQRILIFLAFVFVLHFLVGTGLWVTFISIQSRNVVRNSFDGQYIFRLVKWLPFYSRIWKSTMPLTVSIIALLMVPYRISWSKMLLCGVFIFSVTCASFDICSRDYDLAASGPTWGVYRYLYFTWWWWSR